MGFVDALKGVGIFLLVFLLIGAFLNALNSVSSPIPQKIGGNYIAKEQNGIQVVDLSWGRFNYVPEVIEVKEGIPVRINGDMQRLTGCYRSLIIPSLGVIGQFTEAKPYIDFVPQKKGTFTFSCTMNMARGKITVL